MQTTTREPKIQDPLLKPAEVARLLNVSRSTITRWIQQGLIITVWTHNGMPRIRRSDAEIPVGEC